MFKPGGKFVFLFVAAVFLAGSALTVQAGTALYNGASAKYVFFFIGDGLGMPQRCAATAFQDKELVMDGFEAQGITTTYANDRFITGSAASATALACGQKTNINYIGVDPQFRPVKSVAEMARDKGMKVGIISSVSIDHATPAAFYAHVKTRKMYHEIDHQLAESDFDFFGGGGLKDPTGKKSKKPLGDSVEKARSNGYKIVTDKAEFKRLHKGCGKVLAWNAWLQDDKAMPYAMDTRKCDISLPEFTAKAIELLDNSKGFFLMVEGGKIDWACHANDGTAAIIDTFDFDRSIQLAVDFAAGHPRDTLIVVTGDHECGGLTLGWAGTKYASHFDILGKQKISFQEFTAKVLKEYKDGCRGKCSFDDVKHLITQNFGLKFKGDSKSDLLVLSAYEIDQIKDAYGRSMAGDKAEDAKADLLYGGYEPLSVTLTHILNNKAGLGWTSYKHTGVPVATSAQGVGAEVFNGMYDNTDVALKIMSIMGVPARVRYTGKSVAKAAIMN